MLFSTWRWDTGTREFFLPVFARRSIIPFSSTKYNCVTNKCSGNIGLCKCRQRIRLLCSFSTRREQVKLSKFHKYKHSWRVSGAEAEKDWWLCIKKSLYNRIAGGEGFILFCFIYFIFILFFSFIYFILFCFILFVIFTFNFIYLQV